MTEPEKMSRRDELEALLPFYLNGTLRGDNLASVEEWLLADPAAMAALEAAEAEYSGTTAANEAIRPPADAFSRFSKALDAEAGLAPAAREGLSPLAALWQRFMGLPAGIAWAVAGAAVAFMLVQAVLQPGGRGQNFEIAGSDELAKMPFALVTFKADARMADVTVFLADQKAVIIAGPAAGGVFKLGIPTETVADYDRILALIAAQPFADSVVAGRKPVDG